MTRYARPKKRTAAEDERTLRRELASLLNRRADSITRQDIIRLLDGITDRGAPIMANRTLAAIRKMFNFACGRGVVEGNPAGGVQAPNPERTRDRALSEEEIARLWTAITTTSGTAPALRLALLFALATGQRSGEVRGTTWAEIDLPAATWTMTSERTENGLPHRVPLSSVALAVLAKAQDLGGTFVFPSPKGDGHIDGSAVLHALQRIMRNTGMRPPARCMISGARWPHGWRRTGCQSPLSGGFSITCRGI
ncbi:MAG: integrase family protein [Rhodospirillaceae bacterium]|nr:MAG: integrase family protein [Rhodospirillaceae bacterium]